MFYTLLPTLYGERKMAMAWLGAVRGTACCISRKVKRDSESSFFKIFEVISFFELKEIRKLRLFQACSKGGLWGFEPPPPTFVFCIFFKSQKAKKKKKKVKRLKNFLKPPNVPGLFVQNSLLRILGMQNLDGNVWL